MSLASAYIQVYGKLPEVFSRVSEAQAPEKFTVQYLKDLGFASTNFRAMIPLLKALNFLTAEGEPTPRYREYRNPARARQVMGEALREAYGDLFTIKANPTDEDRPLIEGKFKSTHNVSQNVAKLMTNTFYALLDLADLNATATPAPTVIPTETPVSPEDKVVPPTPTKPKPEERREDRGARPTLHYNIQIHLPATKDVEVFNAIFKALKEHLLD